MADYATGYVTVDGTKLHYYRGGQGKKPIVLLHGATDNGLCWKRVADSLSEHYDVIMPDAQGHGLSDRLGAGFTFLDHARQAAGVANELGLEKPVFIGHSMGGTTAANLAALYPEVPGAIVLEDPGWMIRPAAQLRADHEGFTKNLREQQQKTKEELIVLCRENNPTWHDEELLPWADSKLQVDIALFELLDIENPSYRKTIPEIKCPALLITAENGMISDERVAEVMELWAADTPLQNKKIMGAGHSIHREQFETYCSVLTDFLSSL